MNYESKVLLLLRNAYYAHGTSTSVPCCIIFNSRSINYQTNVVLRNYKKTGKGVHFYCTGTYKMLNKRLKKLSTYTKKSLIATHAGRRDGNIHGENSKFLVIQRKTQNLVQNRCNFNKNAAPVGF